MKIGQRVYYIRNNEVLVGTMVYNNRGIVAVKTQKNRIIRVRFSQLADTLSDDIRSGK